MEYPQKRQDTPINPTILHYYWEFSLIDLKLHVLVASIPIYIISDNPNSAARSFSMIAIGGMHMAVSLYIAHLARAGRPER